MERPGDGPRNGPDDEESGREDEILESADEEEAPSSLDHEALTDHAC